MVMFIQKFISHFPNKLTLGTGTFIDIKITYVDE